MFLSQPWANLRSVLQWMRVPADRGHASGRAIEMRTYTEQEAMRALTSTGGFLRGFAYSLNPYIGCAFGAGRGCPFCYVRALPVARARRSMGRVGDREDQPATTVERELTALARSGKLVEAQPEGVID
jgi:DNA repair photolyase